MPLSTRCQDQRMLESMAARQAAPASGLVVVLLRDLVLRSHETAYGCQFATGSTTLSDQEAWWNEFADEFHELCGLAGTLYPLNAEREPREAAEVAFMTLG